MADETTALAGAVTAPAEQEVHIAALFTADLEPETVQVPGWPGCWFTMKAMDASERARYDSVGTRQVLQGDKLREVSVSLDRNAMEWHLFAHTVRDFRLVRTKPVPGSPGETTREESPMPRDARVLRAWFDDMTPEFRDWLVGEMARVNGIRQADQGNSPASSPN